MTTLAQDQIFQVLGAIPKGKIATYGQVADLAGLPNAARLVGTTLKKLPKDTKLPWHRVVNARGQISLPMNGGGKIQKERLELEGISMVKGRISLQIYRWHP